MAARFSSAPPGARLPLAGACLVAALWMSAAPRAAAQEAGAAGDAESAAAADYAQRRRDLEAEMHRLQTELARFEDREASLLERLERLRLQARLREQEVRASELERRRLERAVDRLHFQIERLRERLERRRAALGARLRAAYRRGPLVPARALAVGAASSEWARALGLLEHLARRDAREIEAMRTDGAALELALAQHSDALRQREVEARRAEERRLALARTLREHQDLLESVRGDREIHRAAYSELQSAARELDALIGRVEAGQGAPADDSAWASLGPFRGLLDHPVAGTLRLPFGDVRHPRFGTMTPHRGLSFGAAAGSEVRAVFEGEVVFQDWLRGYGQTVILDHHHGYLTVYAHLGSPAVRPGEHVPRGGVLGQVGDSGSLEGPQLYFELRRDGVPLDPQPWLGTGARRSARLGGRP